MTMPRFRAAALLLAAILAGCATPTPQSRAVAPVTVKIIAFNDFHGNLQSPGRLSENHQAAQRPAVGGADALAAWVARLKSRNPDNVVVGGGDFVGASPLVSALFFDEPTVEALNRVGVDFTSVGNHEFDKGSAELLRLQHGGCRMTNGQPDPDSCSDAEWSAYVFNRSGSPGVKYEWWCHLASGYWFIAQRDTLRDVVLATLPIEAVRAGLGAATPRAEDPRA